MFRVAQYVSFGRLLVVMTAVIIAALIPFSPQAESRSASGDFQPFPADKQSIPSGDVIVQFENGISAGDRREIRDEAGAKFEDTLPLPNTQVVSARGTDTSVAELVSTLKSTEGVAYAEPDYPTVNHSLPNDTYFYEQWGLHNTGPILSPPNHFLADAIEDADVDAPEAWELENGSQDVVVALVDSGFDYTHPELDDSVWENAGESGDDANGNPRQSNGVDDDDNGKIDDYRGWNFYVESNDPMDYEGHGTGVGGVIAAKRNNGIGIAGISPTTKIMPLKAVPGGTQYAVKAIDYAGQMGADVLNASFGTGAHSQALLEVIAKYPRMIVVTAAGNDPDDSDAIENSPCNFALKNVVCVTGTRWQDDLHPLVTYGLKSVDLAAPTAFIRTTQPVASGASYPLQGGTSFAAPFVSATAALLKSRNPLASVAQIRKAIEDSVDVRPSLVGKTVTGGRLNIPAAIEEFDTYDITSDTTGPGTEITYPVEGRWANTNQIHWVSGGTPAVTTECSVDGAPFTPCTSPATDSVQGERTFTVRQTDADGVTTESSVNYRRDSAPVTGEILSPVGTIYTNRPTINFTISSLSGFSWAHCVIYNEDVTYFEPCHPGMQWPEDIPEGEYALSFRVSTVAGGFLHLPGQIVIASPIPDVSITAPTGVVGTATPTVEFSATHGSGIESTICAVDGHWETALPCTSGQPIATTLGQGSHVITVRATSNANGTAEASTEILVDSLPPALSITAPAGAIYTDTPTIEFAASAPSGIASMTCSIDAGDPVPCESGMQWITALDSGPHTLSVQIENVAGNVATASSDFTIADPAPELSVTGPVGFIGNANPAPSFSSSHGSGIASTVCAIDGDWAQSAPCTSGEPLGVSLGEGSHTLSVRATSNVGGVSEGSVGFFVDTQGPSLVVHAPSGTIYTNRPTMSFTASAASGINFVHCVVYNEDVTLFFSCADGMQWPDEIPEGSYTLSIRVVSNAGGFISVQHPLEIASPVPTVELTAPSGPIASASPTPQFSAAHGSGVASTVCAIDGDWDNPIACTSGDPLGVTLTEGVHTLTVRATSNAGASAEASSEFLVDSVPPVVSVTGPSGNISTARPTIRFATSSPSGIVSVECAIDGDWGTSFPCSDGFVWPSDLSAGSHTASVRVINGVGSVGQGTSSFSYLPPVLTTSGPATSPGSAVDLTAEGQLNWAHWGTSAASLSPTRSTNPGLVGDTTKLGAGSLSRTTSGVTGFTWTNGTPVASATNSRTAIYTGAGNGRGFKVSVDASNSEVRTVKLYVGVLYATGTLTASMSDGSSAGTTATSVTNNSAISVANRVYTVQFRSAAPDATLDLEWRQTSSGSTSLSRVYLQSLTVTD